MKRCSTCLALADAAQKFCKDDGGPLEADFYAADLQQTLGEKYKLTHLIGQGSMGAVYRARHRDLGDVAIKVMLESKNKAQLAARFVREAQSLRQLRHPNTVVIYDLERSASGVTYMVMEYVAGTSLRQELDKRKSLPLEEVVVIAEAVCEALQEAHEHGIIHRDVKPDNILVAEKKLNGGNTLRTIKLVDFGVVKVPATPEVDSGRQITRTGMPVGTPYYMSPEQWLGDGTGLHALDGRADLYTLGGTLYEMLAGRVVFQALTTKEMRQFHLSSPPTPLHQIVPQVPEPVSRVIMKVLAKDRDDRYLTAKAFAQALRAAYDESFRSTAKLSAERLEAAARVWGRSDAPVNEQQLAPTFNPLLNQAAPSAKELAPPVTAEIVAVTPTPADTEPDILSADFLSFAPTDSGAGDEPEVIAEVAAETSPEPQVLSEKEFTEADTIIIPDAEIVRPVPSGQPEKDVADDEVTQEARGLFVPPVLAQPPDTPAPLTAEAAADGAQVVAAEEVAAPVEIVEAVKDNSLAAPLNLAAAELGDTFMGRQAQKTNKLDQLSTVQMRGHDVTAAPLTPPLIFPPAESAAQEPVKEPPREATREAIRDTAKAEIVTPPVIVTEPVTPPVIVTEPAAPPVVPVTTQKPAVPATRPEEETHQIIWDGYAARERAGSQITETLPPAKPVPPPAPRPLWQKVAFGGGVAVLLVLAGVAVSRLLPKPPPPNDNTPIGPNLGRVTVPMMGSVQVTAPPSSGIFVDDERKETVAENGRALVQVGPGVHDLRVTLVRGDDLQIASQEIEVAANQMADVTAAFTRRPGLTPGASRSQAESLARSGNYLAAEAEYLQLLREDPSDLNARADLAQVLAMQKRYAEALELQETVARVLPSDVKQQLALAQLYALKGLDTEAGDVLRRSQRLAGNNAKLLTKLKIDLANLLARNPESLDEALRIVTDAVTAQPNEAAALDAQARVLLERAAPAEAVKAAEKAVQRAPRELAWQATRAVALLRAGDVAGALEQYRKLRQADKNGAWSDARKSARQRFYGKNFLESLTALQMQMK